MSAAAMVLEVAQADGSGNYEIRLRIANGRYGYDGWVPLSEPSTFEWCTIKALTMREALLAAFPSAQVGIVAVYGTAVTL